MLQLIPVFEGDTVVVRASGKLRHEDYQAFLPKLESLLEEHKKVSILLELDHFQGWDLEAIKDDFKLGIKHYNDFERIAIVGDKVWERWMASMAKPFMLHAEIQYFDREKLQDAWDWLREKQNIELAAEQLIPYKNILCAVDFSVYSKYAAKRAAELAAFYQARLTLLHITRDFDAYQYYPGDFLLSGGGPPYDQALVEKQNEILIEKTEEEMKHFVSDLAVNINLQTEIGCGERRSTLLSYLEAQNIDLVVFGSKKKKGLDKLHGTLSHYIHNHSRCEILVTPLVDITTFST